MPEPSGDTTRATRRPTSAGSESMAIEYVPETYIIVLFDLSVMADDSELEYEEEQDGAADASADDELPIVEGVVFGVVGVVLTYLTHLFATVMAAGQTSPQTYTDDGATVVTDMVATWVAAGWSYLGTFGVGFEADGEAATLGDAPNHAAGFAFSPFALADTVLVIVTIGVLVGLGYLVARYTDAADAVDAAKAGAIVVVPYLVFAVVAAFLMTHTFGEDVLVGSVIDSVAGLEADQYVNDDGEFVGDVEFGADTTDAVLLAGLVVPAAFSVFGALLTQWEDAVERVVAKIEEQR